ncbi:epoxide hydrolase family protein [Kibdelosporangium phytohabitans]|uniref:Epoxide hydrolase n=1 Tax=Kibdelosporangium phytohabitans TaxID=860235 RepID=A0A0N9I834_9PSEU|nr:epoxide hydrolase family protein [Kibdelosporangium phytohabitans]ALG12034.1 epoxide hydrolase [Kibdelosporangium phytohabitans]MBE1463512.1 pimeloyl-ACP methyl ester carboxylesterase [Kibdelosporangium phytohabitans]
MTQEIRPFSIAIPQADLDDLIDRVARARWPHHPAGGDWSRGVPVDYLKQLAEYWAGEFDWRAREAQLNEIPQFVTTIDGQDIHFLHVKSQRPDAVPLLMTHGWPSSPFEFTKVIQPLVEAGFDVVAPALPGYGFSTPVNEPGWGNLFRVAGAWAELMRRLDYSRYAVHGTDAGSGVSLLMPVVAAEHVIGVHLSGTSPALPFGPPIDTDGLTGEDLRRAEHFNQTQQDGIGYLHIQATRPQTVGYGLTDSPIAQLAWIVEKFKEWTFPASKLPQDKVDIDQVLTNVTIAWFTQSGLSSAHAVYEGMQVYRQMAAQQGDGDQAAWGPSAPVGYAVFAGDDTIRSLVDPAGQIAHWSEFDAGGHFPAMEVPDLLAADISTFFDR